MILIIPIVFIFFIIGLVKSIQQKNKVGTYFLGSLVIGIPLLLFILIFMFILFH